LKNLTAIEGDDLSFISSPFFYRSFVRQFASKVKIDYEAIADAVQEAVSTMPEPLVPGQEEIQPIHVSALKMRRPRNLRWLRSVASFCIVVTACSGMYAVWQNSHANWHGLLTNVVSQIENVVKPAAAPASNKSLPASNRAQLSNAVPVQPEFHVQLSAIERSWLSIVADDKEVFSGVLDASETKILEGHQSARIRTGNAGGLSFTFNGKDIGVLGPRGQVRTVVFTTHNYKVLPSPAQVAFTAFIQSAE
jgi:cytoskeletal protein RodZ